MIGRKSIFTDVKISDNLVRIQANKNHGICDVVLGTKSDSKFIPTRRLSKVLSVFQGRQYDDPEVFNYLIHVLSKTLV